MNLVTREEFDQHLALMSRLEEKTAALEAELEALRTSTTINEKQ
jgi:BMFP domain-containing protein YqiC